MSIQLYIWFDFISFGSVLLLAIFRSRFGNFSSELGVCRVTHISAFFFCFVDLFPEFVYFLGPWFSPPMFSFILYLVCLLDSLYIPMPSSQFIVDS